MERRSFVQGVVTAVAGIWLPPKMRMIELASSEEAKSLEVGQPVVAAPKVEADFGSGTLYIKNKAGEFVPFGMITEMEADMVDITSFGDSVRRFMPTGGGTGKFVWRRA